jgi:ribosomal protein S27AE
MELRFQMAVPSPPKKLYGSFARHRFIHGNPVVCGVLGILRGMILFPLYLYYDLLRARQGIIEYRKVSHHLQATFEEKVTFDAGQQLSSVDEAVIGFSEIPLCPRCKRQMVFLADQQKWWCEKCKRAAYVT